MDEKLNTILESLKTVVDKVDAAPMVEEQVDEIGMFGYTCILIGLVCMALSTAYFYMAAMRAKPGTRQFEVLSMMVTGIATVLYMTMFSGAGRSVIYDNRQFFWGRYVDWLLTTPLMLWDVLAIAGAPADDIMLAVGVDALMIGFGMVGAQTPSQQKWVFFAAGMLCFCHVCQTLLNYTSVKKFGAEAQALYCRVAYMTIVLWTLYPVVWVVAEGARLVTPSLEACLYMIMDVSSKCVFGFLIVNARSALEACQLDKVEA